MALALALLVAQLPAQRPPSWVAAGTPGVPPSAIQHRGKILWFVDGGRVFAFSAATRSWADRAVSAAPVIRHTNDWLLVEDGGTIAAFGAARARFETIRVTPQAAVVNSAAGINDEIALVLDGTTLWWFSGLAGRWQRRAVSTTASFAVQRNTAPIADGRQLWALSALYDAWVPHTSAGPVASYGVGDTVAWATDGSEVHGFSAILGGWSSAPLPPNGSNVPSLRNDAAVWDSDSGLLGFSGVCGRFDAVVTGETTNVAVADHLGHAASADRLRHWLFSVPHGRWTPLRTAQPASALLDGAVALLLEPGCVHAYGAMLAGVSTLPVAASASDVAATVAAVLDAGSGAPWLFSALTQAWYAAPATAVRALPVLTRNGALLDDGARLCWAFSARSGRFVARAGGAHPTLHGDSSSAILAIEDDRALAVFEPRREVWLETPVQPGERPLRVAIWRTTLVAATPTEAIGFGALHGALERTALPGAAADVRASSEVGGVVTAADVLGYSPVADLRSDAQFPEFRRMTTRGVVVDLRFAGAPGARAGAVLGWPSAHGTEVPGLGELTLDLGLLLPFEPGALDQDGLTTFRLPIPDLIELTGIELACQAVFFPLGGQPYLSRMGSFRIAAAETAPRGCADNRAAG